MHPPAPLEMRTAAGVRWDVGALLSVKRRKAVSDSEAVRAAREA